MSELPQTQTTTQQRAVAEYVMPAVVPTQRTWLYARRPSGEIALVRDADGLLCLPEAAAGPAAANDEEEAPVEVCTYLGEPGRTERFRTRVLAAGPGAIDALDATQVHWMRPNVVRGAWERGDELLAPATRHALSPDGLGGEGLSPLVRCLAVRTPTLPPATHTNCYVLRAGAGLEARGAFVIDPASPDTVEQERLARSLDRYVGRYGAATAIVLTHHHNDHIGGVEALRAQTGLPVWAHPETAARLRFPVDRLLEDGERIGEWEVLFTPGHAPGHLCLWHAAHRLLVVGDMVASVGTIVVEPRDGDMQAYLDNLQRLKALGARLMFPAHGAPITAPEPQLARYITHRLWRHDKVRKALGDTPEPVADVAARAYPEVAPEIRWLAELSTEAHLEKLRRDSEASCLDGRWCRL